MLHYIKSSRLCLIQLCLTLVLCCAPGLIHPRITMACCHDPLLPCNDAACSFSLPNAAAHLQTFFQFWLQVTSEVKPHLCSAAAPNISLVCIFFHWGESCGLYCPNAQVIAKASSFIHPTLGIFKYYYSKVDQEKQEGWSSNIHINKSK